MMTTEPSHALYTYEDYLQTPDDVRYELIEGELLVMEPAPTTSHQKILVNLTVLLAPFVREHGLGEVLIAPTDVHLSNTNVLQPDLLFVSAARASIITERDVHDGPDLVVEIASPTTRRRDRGIKMEIYARHGVAEYWLVEPDTAIVETLRLEDGRMVPAGRYGREETFTTPLLPGLDVDLKKIF